MLIEKWLQNGVKFFWFLVIKFKSFKQQSVDCFLSIEIGNLLSSPAVFWNLNYSKKIVYLKWEPTNATMSENLEN